MAKKRKLEQNDVVSPPESPPSLSHDDLLQIIKPFTHNQLSEIVITASLRHPDVIESIRSIADANPSRRSLSIQNLDQSTTTRRLAALFAKFGELEKAKVVRGKVSRKCKGYVVYKHVDSALLALKEPSKLIDGKITVVQLVDDVGKSKKKKKKAMVLKKAGLGTVDVSLRRVYVDNVDEDMDCEKLLECFEKYGEIEEGPGGFYKETGKFRGFAVIVYKNVEGVKACLVDPVKVVDGRKLRCRHSKEGDSVQGGRGGQVLGVGDEGLGKGELEAVDVSSRRVCVGNVPAEMDCGKLLKHFEMYGEIEDGPLGFDRKTGKFKGFAFIVYRNVEGVKACLVDPVKIIDGHELNCRLASIMKRNISSVGVPQVVTAAQVPGSVDGGKGEVVISKQKSSKKGSSMNGVVAKEKLETVDVSLRRVYVGNVPTEMDCEKLLEHFSTYGEVEGGPLGFDKKTGKFKGFAFIVYKNLYGVRACLVDPVKIIDGHKLDCRLAVSKQGNPSGVSAPQVVTAAQVPGLGDGGDTEVVISKQKSSKKGSLKNRVIAKENLETVDVSLRRVYIGNVPSEMECEKLLEHFSMYGEVEGGPLSYFNKKGKFRGFAFIIYKNVDGAKACLVDPVKMVDGHELSCRLAIPRKGLAPALGSGNEGVAKSNLESVDVSSRKGLAIPRKGLTPALGSGNERVAKSNLESVDVSSRKVYVGNVPHGMKREKLLAHFSLYGEVEDEPLGFHKKPNCNDGFAFIVYKNVEGAKACLVDPIKTIDGYQLHCRLAIPRKWNSSTVTAPVATAAKVQGSDNRGKRKFVNLEEQSSMQSSFAGGGRSGVSDYLGNMGGLGLPAGPYAHGISGYGGGGHGQPLEHSQHLVNLNLGGGFGLTSSLSNGGRSGLGLFSFGRNDGGRAPIGGGNGSSHFGGISTSYCGTDSDRGVGPGNGANYGGTRNGEVAELITGASYGGMHNGGGMGLETGFGARSSSYGGIGTGGMGLGIGFGGSSHISHYGLSPGYARMSSEGYSESANYSLSSGSTDQAHQQHKNYQACYLNYK